MPCIKKKLTEATRMQCATQRCLVVATTPAAKNLLSYKGISFTISCILNLLMLIVKAIVLRKRFSVKVDL